MKCFSCGGEGGQPASWQTLPKRSQLPSLSYSTSPDLSGHLQTYSKYSLTSLPGSDRLQGRAAADGELPPSGANNFCFPFAKRRASLWVWPLSLSICCAEMLRGYVCTAACRDLQGKGPLSAWNKSSIFPNKRERVRWGRGGSSPAQELPPCAWVRAATSLTSACNNPPSNCSDEPGSLPRSCRPPCSSQPSRTRGEQGGCCLQGGTGGWHLPHSS